VFTMVCRKGYSVMLVEATWHKDCPGFAIILNPAPWMHMDITHI